MQLIQYSLVLHLIGVGLIFTSIVGGWILNRQYRKAMDWKTKALVLKSLRPIVWLFPLAVLVLLASGIGNMNLGTRTYTLFSDAWLSYKLIFFLILVIAGIFFGIRRVRRGRIVTDMAEGSASETSARNLEALDRQQSILYLFQIVMLLLILTLSIVKPN